MTTWDAFQTLPVLMQALLMAGAVVVGLLFAVVLRIMHDDGVFTRTGRLWPDGELERLPERHLPAPRKAAKVRPFQKVG